MARPKKAATVETEAAPAAETRKRGRPRKDRTETPPPRKATNGPTVSQIQDWLSELTEIDTSMARVRQRGSTLKKTVENASGDWKALKAAFASTKLSQAEAVEKLEKNVQYHAAINVRVSWDGDQATMADVLDRGDEAPNSRSEERLAAARAHGDGYNSGKVGAAPSDNPFHPGTEPYVQWHKGRDDGQLDRDLGTVTATNGAHTNGAEHPDSLNEDVVAALRDAGVDMASDMPADPA